MKLMPFGHTIECQAVPCSKSCIQRCSGPLGIDDKPSEHGSVTLRMERLNRDAAQRVFSAVASPGATDHSVGGNSTKSAVVGGSEAQRINLASPTSAPSIGGRFDALASQSAGFVLALYAVDVVKVVKQRSCMIG